MMMLERKETRCLKGGYPYFDLDFDLDFDFDGRTLHRLRQ